MTTDLTAAAGRAARRSSEMPMDDPALVEALRSGDPQAPRLLIERYQGVVFGLCYRMMNHQQDAEDVAQETFIRALRAMAGFDAARPIRPWLLEIAANRCRTALARRGRRPMLTLAEPVEQICRPPCRAGRSRRPGRRAGTGLERAAARISPGLRLVPRAESVVRRDRPDRDPAGRHRQNLAPSRSGPTGRIPGPTRNRRQQAIGWMVKSCC